MFLLIKWLSIHKKSEYIYKRLTTVLATSFNNGKGDSSKEVSKVQIEYIFDFCLLFRNDSNLTVLIR